MPVDRQHRCAESVTRGNPGLNTRVPTRRPPLVMVRDPSRHGPRRRIIHDLPPCGRRLIGNVRLPGPCRCSPDWSSHRAVGRSWLSFEGHAVWRQGQPRLRASGPEMDPRHQPRCIVQCAATYDPDPIGMPIRRARPGFAEQPGPAIPTDPPLLDAPAIRNAAERKLRHCPAAAECRFWRDHADRACAACQALALRAMARVYQDRLLCDLVAHRTAYASAGQGQFHRAPGSSPSGI